MSKVKMDLVIIDPQNDFCDIPEALCPENPLGGGKIRPALPVPGAHDDMLRLADTIRRLGRKINDIHVTLDSHNPIDIAHPAWWKNGNGQNPAPFTQILAADIRAGIWKTSNPLAQAYSLAYAEALESAGRYPLLVWPEHCLIGSWGHNVHMSVKLALDEWARDRLEVVNFVTKGSNPKTEHYSAVQAEVPDPDDSTTMLNTALIQTLANADRILIAGEALSHCVANTVRDIANNFGEDNVRKMVLIRDCSSPVTGFEGLADDFLKEMTGRGMQVINSTDL